MTFNSIKYALFSVIFFPLAGAAPAQICHPQLHLATLDGQCNTDPFVLVFEDNFDGDSLDVSTWQIQPWGQGSLLGDNTQQYYSLDNVSVSSGICSITARRDTVLRPAVNWLPDDTILADGLPNLRTYYYTSSNLWTLQRFGYGIFEIRCRIPSGRSFWPAFWAFGSDSAGSSEIDVFEFWDDNTVTHHMTAHYHGMMCESDYDGPDFSTDFHTFRVAWDPYKIDWYTDSVLKRQMTRYNTILGQHVDCDGVEANNLYLLEKTFPDDSLNMIMNLAIQSGTYAPDSATPFPAALDVDYVRYYTRVPVTGTVTVLDTNGRVQGERKITVYPNPNTGLLTVRFSGRSPLNPLVSLVNAAGEVVCQSPPVEDNTITLDLRNYKKGVYVLQVQDAGGHSRFTCTILLN